MFVYLAKKKRALWATNVKKSFFITGPVRHQRGFSTTQIYSKCLETREHILNRWFVPRSRTFLLLDACSEEPQFIREERRVSPVFRVVAWSNDTLKFDPRVTKLLFKCRIMSSYFSYIRISKTSCPLSKKWQVRGRTCGILQENVLSCSL